MTEPVADAARRRALNVIYDTVRAVLDRDDQTTAPEFEALDELYAWSLEGLRLRNEQAAQQRLLQQLDRRIREKLREKQ